MVAVYGDHVPSCTTVFEWDRHFKDERLNIEDDPRCGRPITATAERTIKAVENLIIEDRRIAIQQVAYALPIELARRERVQSCRELLARYSAEGNDFLSRIVTGNESFLYFYQPESKQSSKQWKRIDSPLPTKLKQEKSASKVLYSFLWAHKGIMRKTPTPADTTITKIYYANILVNELHPEIKKQRRGLILAGVILHHDGAPVHTSHLVSSNIHNLKYELLRHPPYSPDLASSNYFLVSVLKDYLAGRYQNDRSSIGSSIYQCLNSTSEDAFTAAIQKLPER